LPFGVESLTFAVVFDELSHQWVVVILSLVSCGESMDNIDNTAWYGSNFDLLATDNLICSVIHLPKWIHLDVVGRLTPSKDVNQEFTTPDINTPN
jgi:hypothetical protein